jgi:hypothetical protein
VPSVSPHSADYLAGVHANAADQFLVSYLALTRFPHTSPYALGFALGHCLELSIKAAHWHRTQQAPVLQHSLDGLIEKLPDDLKDELEKILPNSKKRDRFRSAVKQMHKAPTLKMLKTYFTLNPRADDDEWLVLYIMYVLPHIKYGVDKEEGVLQLFQPAKPKLNKIALRAIGRLRREFPFENRTLAEFMEHYVTRAPDKGLTVSRLMNFLETNAQRERSSSENPVSLATTRQEPEAATSADSEKIGPNSSLVFESEELRLIAHTLSVPLGKHLDPDGDLAGSA